MENSSIYPQELNLAPHWYALHTRPRHEKKVAERLELKGVTNYLPLNEQYRQWSDRCKKVYEPLFSCYVFVNMTLKERFKALQTDGVMRLVSFRGIPAVIPDKQIDDLRHVLEKLTCVECANFFAKGKRVRIIRGSFRGIEGILINQKNQYRLVLQIDGIQQGISLEISISDLELIN